jgi:hypothetical protein
MMPTCSSARPFLRCFTGVAGTSSSASELAAGFTGRVDEYHPVVLRSFSPFQHAQGEFLVVRNLSVLPLLFPSRLRKRRRGRVRRRVWPDLIGAIEVGQSISFGCRLHAGARARFSLVQGGRNWPA